MEEKSVINCIASISKSLSVWTGSNSGFLIACTLTNAVVAAESLSFKRVVSFTKSWSLWSTQAVMSLTCGSLSWETNGQILNQILVKDIYNVQKLSANSFCISTSIEKFTFTSDFTDEIDRLLHLYFTYSV